MIRDPSDGTVREKPSTAGIPTTKLEGPDTGLRQPTRTDAMQRLDKSREWLKTYHAEYRNAIDDANRMNDKGEVTNARGNDGEELPQTGHSIEGERDAEPASSARSAID